MISGVILAAGLSKRMGEGKQGLLISGKPMLRWVEESFADSKVGEVITVVSETLGADTTRPEGPRTIRVVNHHPEEGLSSSVRLGIQAVRGEAAIIGLGDQPALRSATLNAMIEAYQGKRGKIIVPTFRNARGTPVLFDRSLFVEILKLRGDFGAKSVIANNMKLVYLLEVQDEGIIFDVDTPADLTSAAERVARARSDERESR